MIELSWTQIKSKMDSGLRYHDQLDLWGNTNIVVADGSIYYKCILDNPSSDYDDWTNNYSQNSKTSLSAIDQDTGMPSISTKKLPSDWYPEFREIELETSTLNSLHDKDSSDNDLGDHSLIFYDSSHNEIVNPDQATLDTDCCWTHILFDPSKAWAIRGAYTRQIQIPQNPVYVWSEFYVLVDPAPYYLTLPYANGGLNMEFQDVRQSVGDEGENYSFFTANDSIFWKIKHNAGFKHRIRIIYQLAFEVGA